MSRYFYETESGESFQDGVALCQVIPGAIVMQMAAYIGLKVRGVPGAMASYIGFGLPAFFLMTALSVLYSVTHALPAAISIFSGLQAVIVAVVANAAVSFGKTSLKNRRNVLVSGIAAGHEIRMSTTTRPHRDHSNLFRIPGA